MAVVSPPIPDPPTPDPPVPDPPALDGTTAKGVSVGLIAGLAAAGMLLAAAAAVTAWCCWRRRQAVQPAEAAVGCAKEGDVLKIHVEKPADADHAMRSLHAPAALVTTPWRPLRPT